MFKRSIGSLLALIIGSSLFCGCKPAELPVEKPKPAPPAPETLARLHWLGKDRLAADTNAGYFLAVWGMPESRRLEIQTLDKLALFLARTPVTPSPVLSNSPAALLLRPVLDDVVRAESYLEIQRMPGGPLDVALAVRLDDARAALWETNLTAALDGRAELALPTATNGVRRWQWAGTNHLTLTRAGGWTAVGLDAEARSRLVGDLLTRVQGQRAAATLHESPDRIKNGNLPTPALNSKGGEGEAAGAVGVRRREAGSSALGDASSETNSWIEVALDLRALADAFEIHWAPPPGWPTAFVSVTGDGLNVRWRADLKFPKPLALELEAWNLPTNFVEGNLASFSAIRGLGPWLASTKAWTDLDLGPAPRQFFAWGLQGLSMFSAFATPQPDASNQVSRASELLMRQNETWFGTNNNLARFIRAPDSNGLAWKGLPYLAPCLRSATTNGDPFVLGSLGPMTGVSCPLPAELLGILDQTNLVAYSWDLTGMRIEQLVYIGQFWRFVTGHAQLTGPSASQSWFLASPLKLGNCATMVTLENANQLAVVRKSSIGLSALELHLLADWLESPQFPRGCFTLLAPPPIEDIPLKVPAGPPPPGGAKGRK